MLDRSSIRKSLRDKSNKGRYKAITEVIDSGQRKKCPPNKKPLDDPKKKS